MAAKTFALPRSSTIRVFLIMTAYVLLAKLILGFLPVRYTDPSQEAIFQWSSIAILLAAGLIGAWLAERSGFAPAWNGAASVRQRVLIPALIGVAFGAISLVANNLLRLPKVEVAFPASIFVYSAGAIVVEVFYRLVTLPLLLWLISAVVLRNKGQDATFWVLAVLLSVLEPLAQGRALAGMGISGLPLSLTVLEIYIANLVQAYFFRRYGLLASLVIRLSHYMVWHVIGNL